MARLSGAYLFETRKGDKEKAEKLKDAFFDLCDHLLDQGYAEGDGNISNNGFDSDPVLAMRGELSETGRLRGMLLACASCALAGLSGEALMTEDWENAGFFARNLRIVAGYERLLA